MGGLAMRIALVAPAALAMLSFALAAELTSPQTAHLAVQSANPLTQLRLEDLSATRDRPLFSVTRRPPPRPAAPPATEAPQPVAVRDSPPEPPPFDLIGAVVGGANKVVLLRNRATSAVERLREGGALEGWRVEGVKPRSVSLERDGRIETLHLGNQDASAGNPTPQLAGPTAAVAAGGPPQGDSATTQAALPNGRLADKPRFQK
jgi:general secretion pathway protein N